jgi:hypothetical protein
MSLNHKIILQFFLLFTIVNISNAAFPLKMQKPVIVAEISTCSLKNDIKTGRQIFRHAKPAIFAGNHHKKRWLALTLCLLLGWCGMHRFYLGYCKWDDVLELTPTILGVVGASAGILVGLLALFPGIKDVIFKIIVYLLIAAATALVLWELIDFFRIITGLLKPKDGTYR